MSTFKIRVLKRDGSLIQEFNDVDLLMTVDEFKKLFLQKSDFAKKNKLSQARLRFTVGDPKGVALTDKTKQLNHYLQFRSEFDLYFKDLGPQISWTTVFLVEYFGPIAITLILLVFRKQIYGSNPPLTYNQKLGVAAALIHYLKREFETLFVHRFSNDTMPWTNIIKNSLHYWVIFGLLNMYFFLSPKYTPPAWIKSDMTHNVLFGLFLFFEFMNFRCHCILRDLRKPGSTERGIPRGNAFELVSCANYFWESLCWLVFAVQSQVLGAYLFWVFSSGQMLIWAQAKHRKYKKDFGEKYPKGRKAMFPFII